MSLSLPSNASRTVKSLPFFHDIAAVGDEIELRGPLGGHFLWPERATAPVLLIGAGSGVVPLMAMIRQRRALAQTVPTALLLSSRTKRDVLFADELLSSEMADPKFTLALAITREPPGRACDFVRRIDSAMVAELVARLPRMPAHVFVCGSNRFVNIAADGAIMAGLDAAVDQDRTIWRLTTPLRMTRSTQWKDALWRHRTRHPSSEKFSSRATPPIMARWLVMSTHLSFLSAVQTESATYLPVPIPTTFSAHLSLHAPL